MIRERKMTGIDPERLDRRLRWAAEQLGLSPNASLDEVRAAWLRRLPEEDFVPSSELRWALAALLRRPSEGRWEARADELAAGAEEQRLRGEVEAFAELFWEFLPKERRRCWQELMERCAFAPALRARLHLLEAGLNCVSVINETNEYPRVVELAGYVRALFVLRPGPRARARHEIHCRMECERKAWRSDAQYLRLTRPSLASLGNDLLDKIATGPPIPKQLPQKPPPQPAEAKAVKTGGYGCIWVIIFVIASTIRVLTSDNKPSSRPDLPTRIPYESSQPEKDKKARPDMLDRLFDQQQIQDEKVREDLRRKIDEQSKKWEWGERTKKETNRTEKVHE